MPAPINPTLETGRTYRTAELARWSHNPSRLAERLVAEGKLERLGQGLFHAPRRGRFGAVPPSDEALLRGFLEGSPFVLTGPEYWNALGLGATAMFAVQLVYNHKRSGEFRLGRRRFWLRRVRFPQPPTPEWYVVDLFQHHEMAGVSLHTLREGLTWALRAGRFDADALRALAAEYGTRKTQAAINNALQDAG